MSDISFVRLDPDARLAEDEVLARAIREAAAGLRRALEGDHGALSTEEQGYARVHHGQLALLRALLASPKPLLRPELDHAAPLGHSFPAIERELGLAKGAGIELLEGLADLKLLKRELFSSVHVCGQCRHYNVNYRETCVGCSGIDIDVERLVHHFHCAYTGLESEFQHGLELVCPRCRRKLFQLGQDFEWPHDTYVCKACHRIFEDPVLQAQCLVCQSQFPSREAELVKIWCYTPTPLTVRAVELNRLTGLDVSEIMFDTKVRLATHDFLEIEVDREIHRAQRYGGPFSGALLSFQLNGHEFPIFREWAAETILELGRMLTTTLRPLDLVARLGTSRFALLLPETDGVGAQAVERRLRGLLSESKLATRGGIELTPRWVAATWVGKEATHESTMAFFDQGEVQP